MSPTNKKEPDMGSQCTVMTHILAAAHPVTAHTRAATRPSPSIADMILYADIMLYPGPRSGACQIITPQHAHHAHIIDLYDLPFCNTIGALQQRSTLSTA